MGAFGGGGGAAGGVRFADGLAGEGRRGGRRGEEGGTEGGRGWWARTGERPGGRALRPGALEVRVSTGATHESNRPLRRAPLLPVSSSLPTPRVAPRHLATDSSTPASLGCPPTPRRPPRLPRTARRRPAGTDTAASYSLAARRLLASPVAARPTRRSLLPPPAARSSLPCRCPPARPRRPLARRRLAAALPTCTARGTSPRPSPLPCDLLTLLPPRRSPRASRLRPLPSLSPPAALPPRPAPRSTRVCARAPHPPPARQQGRRLGGEECPTRHCTWRRCLGSWPR